MNKINLNSGNNVQNLNKINLLDVIPTNGDGRDHIVQKLIVKNRQTYIPVFISGTDYCIEFIPDLIKSSRHTHTYNFNVYITNVNTNKKEFLLNMNCEGNINRSSFSFLNMFDGETEFEIEKEAFINISYVFEDDMEIITKRFFTLDSEDAEYLKKSFTERFVIISTINYYLTRTITSSYNINNYNVLEFIDVDDLIDIEIKEEYRNIINPLLNNNKDATLFHEKLRFYPHKYDNLDSIDSYRVYINDVMSNSLGISSKSMSDNDEIKENLDDSLVVGVDPALDNNSVNSYDHQIDVYKRFFDSNGAISFSDIRKKPKPENEVNPNDNIVNPNDIEDFKQSFDNPNVIEDFKQSLDKLNDIEKT